MTMPTTLIEARIGNDPGSRAGNNWDKTALKGLELVAEERGAGRRNNYTIGAIEAEAGRVFTVWTAKDGCKPAYTIAIVDPTAEPMEITGYADCYVKGCFRVLAAAEGDTFAKRLMGWYADGCAAQAAKSKTIKEQGGKGIYTWAWQAKFATHLATQITRRGVKDPAPMDAE